MSDCEGENAIVEREEEMVHPLNLAPPIHVVEETAVNVACVHEGGLVQDLCVAYQEKSASFDRRVQRAVAEVVDQVLILRERRT